MMSRFLFFLAGLLCAPLIAVAVVATTPLLPAVINRVVIDTTQLPYTKKVYFVVDTDVYPQRFCWYVDLSQLDKALIVRAPLDVYINATGIILGVTTLMPGDRDICFSSMPPLPVPPPAPVFKVAASGTALTRPLYSGQAWETGIWVKLGTVEVGAVCEQEVIRKTTVDYRYVTNAVGTRGLAACK